MPIIFYIQLIKSEGKKVKAIKTVIPFNKSSSEDKIKYLYLIVKMQTAIMITAIKFNKPSNIIEIIESFKGILNVFIKKILFIPLFFMV